MNIISNLLLSTTFAVSVLTGCTLKSKKMENTNLAGIDLKNMNQTIKVGNDFFEYVNGNWLKTHPIPEDKSVYSAFNELDDKNKEDLRELLDEIIQNTSAPKGSIDQKIRDFMNVGMDTLKTEAQGIEPLKALFAGIDKINSVANFQTYCADLQRQGINPLFDIYADQDRKNSEMMIMDISQGGLGLADRDYYTEDDTRSKEIRSEYIKHLSKMFQLLGDNESQSNLNAQTVMNIETRFAKVSMKRLEMRNPYATYHKMDFAEIAQISKNFDWNAFFKTLGTESPKEINISQPDFIKEMDKMMNEVALADWKTFLRWKVIKVAAPYLSSKFEQEAFHFYSAVMSGNKQMRPRWKRVIDNANDALGEAIGQKYVAKHFPAQAKERMLNLVANLRKALEIRIKGLVWMSEPTKLKALEKLATITVKIGYPDKWKDYSQLDIETDSYFHNVLKSNTFQVKEELKKIGKPVDKTIWHMTPQTVNAYYNPGVNEIVFPAAILQAPFFNLTADDAINYGAIGVVIGHEMTHAFDDEGRKFDKNGNLSDWWTKQDEEAFNKQTQILVEQYNNFVAIKDLHVDGKLTLGENIADFGGLEVSLTAFKLAHPDYEKMEKIDGFTPLQRFFISYAQIWRNNIRDKELMRRIKEDPHSPARFRVNGGVFNIPDFYKAFEVRPNEKLYRPENQRPVIW